MGRPYHDKETLEELYKERGLSGVEIAEHFDVSTETIYTWMDRHDIDRTGNDTSHLPDTKEIARLYSEKDHTVEQIADEFDVSRTPIRSRLKDSNVEIQQRGVHQTPQKLKSADWLREKNHGEELRASEIAELADCSEGAVYSAFRRHGIENIYNRTPDKEAQETLRDADELNRLYHDEKLSTIKIADKLGISASTVHHWMEKHGIERRSKTDLVGELHPRYKEDSEYHVYDQQWARVRETVIQRDDEQCQECGISRAKCKERYDMDLDVHHITPQRKVDDKYDTENLITMCRSCHTSEEQSQ
jgi:transposase-like protein